MLQIQGYLAHEKLGFSNQLDTSSEVENFRKMCGFFFLRKKLSGKWVGIF
jgi:hypothetical protein